jgi:hypothetical protein
MPATPSPYAQDREAAEQPWKLSEEAVRKAQREVASARGGTKEGRRRRSLSRLL